MPVLVATELFPVARDEQQRVVGAGTDDEDRDDRLALPVDGEVGELLGRGPVHPGVRRPRHQRAVPAHLERQDEAPAVVVAQELARRAYEDLGAAGVNILQSSGAAAWQSVFHLHFHVIPRYAGDPLVLPWKHSDGDPLEIAAAASQLREGDDD